MTLAAFDAVTENLPPAVPAPARTPVRPVFVDDGGRRKLLLARAGYLAIAAFVAYLLVIGFSLTALPSGPLAGLGRSTVATPPARSPARVAPAPAPVPSAVPRPPQAVPTPAVVELFAAPVARARPTVSRAPVIITIPPVAALPIAPTRRTRDIDAKPTATSATAPAAVSPSASSKPSSTTARPPATTAAPAPVR